MRYLLLIFTLIASPVFASNPYCACQLVPDPYDPYLRDPSVQSYLVRMGANTNMLPYDCYGINSSGGLGPVSLCETACTDGIAMYESLVSLGMQMVVAEADCDPTHSGNIPTPDPPPDSTGQGCTGSNCGTTGGTGGTGGTGSSGNSEPFPCGYPGAKYLDCNVYDARVETAVKNTTTAVNEVKTAVNQVNAAVNSVYGAVSATTAAVNVVNTSVNTVNTSVQAAVTELKTQTTEIKAQTTELKAITPEVKKTTEQLILTNTKLDAINKTETDGLKKLEDAALHKGVKLTIGSCIEAQSVYDKLPKLSGGLYSDTTLTGFNCSGDEPLCAQIELQAQSYCRDVISQRLQAMYLNGGNVFVACSPGYVGQLNDAGSPVCHLKTGNCLLTGQQPSPGNNYPPCDMPTTVTCPSAEFVPVVIAGGFSCDTKLSAGKFNAQISVFQQFIDAVRDRVGDEALMATKAATLKSSEGFATGFNKLHETFKDGYTNYEALGLKGGALPEGAVDASGLLASSGPSIEIMGYTYKNDLVVYGQRAYDMLLRFVPNPLLIFAVQGSCSAFTNVFQPIESSLSHIFPGGGGNFGGVFSGFSNSLCNTWLPVVRFFMGFFFSFWTSLYVYRSLVQILVVTFGGNDNDFFLIAGFN